MSSPHYFKHERENGESTLILAMMIVLVALLIAGVIFANTGTRDETQVLSSLSPLPPLIDSVPLHDAGQ